MFAARVSAIAAPRVISRRSSVARPRASSRARAFAPIGDREERDSRPARPRPRTLGQSLRTATRLVPAFAFLMHAHTDAAHAAGSVSYTHLTLPTILLV